MNLSGMTQLQVEELFSTKAMDALFKEELKDFIQGIEKEHYLALHKALDSGNDKRFTVQVMVELIAKLGNPKLGIKTDDGRLIEVHHLISVIAGLNTIVERYDTSYRFLVATNIVEEMDTIIFDIIQKKRNDPNYGWITETHAIVQFDVGDKALKLEGLSRYKFPLIEKPINWEENIKGGYHSEEQRFNVTSNRGTNTQPKEVLDVLNILQSNNYKLRDIDMQEEYDYAVKKLTAKAIAERQIMDIPYNVDTRLKTCWETYNAMNELDFYFAWQFDFRGRMYSQGYDINLQADKFKKGMLQPIMLSSITRAKLEKELKELKCQ